MRALFLFLGLVLLESAAAQDWPARAVRIIVPFPAGGSADLMPRSVAEKLAPGGLYTINIIDRPAAQFARAEVATLGRVFPHVAVFAPPGYFTGERGGNYVLVGPYHPIDMEAMDLATRSRGGVEIGLSGARLDQFLDGAEPLTDDFAPVDQMLTGL